MFLELSILHGYAVSRDFGAHKVPVQIPFCLGQGSLSHLKVLGMTG